MTQSKHLCDQTRTLILKSSTLSNGGVYVVPFRRSDPSVRGVGHLVDVPMCGLFAGRVFYHGDVVTLYGGTLMPCSSCSDTTHSRAIPDSDWVLSGLDWARAIHVGVDDMEMEEQSTWPVRERVKIFPPSNYQRNGVTCKLVCETGVGYMANTTTRRRCNVFVQLVQLRKGFGCDAQKIVHPIGLPVLLLKARVTILPHQEILCWYGWG